MRSDLRLQSLSDDYYVLQVNGEVSSCHRRYVDALSAALQLRRRFPLSVIKVRQADELTRFGPAGDEGIRPSRIQAMRAFSRIESA